MLSAAFDFLGEMIEQSYQIWVKKLSTKEIKEVKEIKESRELEECSIKGSYNSEETVQTPSKKGWFLEF